MFGASVWFIVAIFTRLGEETVGRARARGERTVPRCCLRMYRIRRLRRCRHRLHHSQSGSILRTARRNLLGPAHRTLHYNLLGPRPGIGRYNPLSHRLCRPLRSLGSCRIGRRRRRFWRSPAASTEILQGGRSSFFVWQPSLETYLGRPVYILAGRSYGGGRWEESRAAPLDSSGVGGRILELLG